ncbi:MAG: hypothetical protein JNN22_09330 [Rhodospirillales bacterium]|nr:hypothetical protein [Rhodospirillales bacterium]
MKRATLVLIIAAALASGGCSDLTRQQTFIAGGAVAGAALGAYAFGTTGAALAGAAVGGTGGYLSEMIWRPATPR